MPFTTFVSINNHYTISLLQVLTALHHFLIINIHYSPHLQHFVHSLLSAASNLCNYKCSLLSTYPTLVVNSIHYTLQHIHIYDSKHSLLCNCLYTLLFNILLYFQMLSIIMFSSHKEGTLRTYKKRGRRVSEVIILNSNVVMALQARLTPATTTHASYVDQLT